MIDFKNELSINRINITNGQMNSQEKTTIVFNRVLADFVKDVSKASDELKAKNRAVYKEISLSSTAYVESFVEKCERGGVDGDVLDDAFQVLETATVGELIDATRDAQTVSSYVLLLSVIAGCYKTPADNDLDAIMGIASKAQDGDADDDVGADIDAARADEPIKALLRRLAIAYDRSSSAAGKESSSSTTSSASASAGGGGPKFPFDPSLIENTMIGSIAKEVVAELDVSDAQNATSMEDLFKSMSGGGTGAGDAGNLIGSIVSKVGSKLQSKISSGGLNQQDLVKEAFSMFGPLMGDMMKNMPNNNVKRNSNIRDRLRKKVDARG